MATPRPVTRTRARATLATRAPLSVVCLLVLACAPGAFAQSAEPEVRAVLDNVTTVERWSFFEPPPEGGDSDYTLVGNRARLGVAVTARRVAFEGSFQYAQLLGLPEDAFGPGPLGPGALYFLSAQTPQAYQLYIKSASITWRDAVPHLSLRAGRMPYTSGEDTPFEGRLIGTADWTPFERAFDGIRADYTPGGWTLHGAFVMPTQGAFEESVSPTIGKVQLSTVRWHRAAVELFAHNYRDTRNVRARPDNTGIPAPAVDVHVQTAGGSVVARGIHAWLAVQRGSWYDERHRAFSASVDAGREWAAGWTPSMRGGILYASGDRNPNDERHGTFLPMVPTTQPETLRGTFAQMNLRTLFVKVAAHPVERVRVEADWQHLALATGLDRWYSGTGATAFDGNYFGFSTRRSTLARSLGTLMTGAVRWQVSEAWTLRVAAGAMRGGDVVRRQFAGRTLRIFSVESALRFD